MSSDRHMPLRRTGRTGQAPSSFRRAPRPATGRRVLPKWARPGRPVTPRPPRGRMQTFLTALPSLVAVGALIFTWVSIVKTTDATNHQLQITEQGQVTDRYNVAITNLGSTSEDIRLGGIYALRRVMEDSPRDQSAIVAVLCAFVRNHTIVPTVAPS